MNLPISSEDDSFKIAVIDYCATSEGRHIYIKSGTNDYIKSNVGDFLYAGASIYTVKQWLEIANDKNFEGYINLEILQSFAPMLWDAMESGVNMDVDIEYHLNDS
ncbi:hypothetical protein AB4143_05160 [Vibrio breoganii]